MTQYKLTISNILILLSVVFTLLTLFVKDLSVFGMHRSFFEGGIYHIWILQFFTSQFLHASIMHLLFNSIFIYYFANILEKIIGQKKMLLFFITNSIFLGIVLTSFSRGLTIGISGFVLATLSYYTLLLKEDNNPEYKGGVTAIIISIAIGLTPGISFLGHLGGVIFGVIFFFLMKIMQKKLY